MKYIHQDQMILHKNPLDPDTKIGYMQQMFPTHAKHIMNNPNDKNNL